MTGKVETSEAICSALYRMPFAEFLGEQDSALTEGRTAWFHLGQKPKDMRVAVVIPDDAEEVRIELEWRNYSADARSPLKGHKTLTISAYAKTTAELMEATQAAIVRLLECFREVNEETGIAGPIEGLVG